jgi:curved DNA-binding protein CbpA
VNYYDLLQIHPRAELETMHRVYRLFAGRYHPDNHQTGDAERFRMIAEAYEVLSDPETRAAYDKQLEESQPPAMPIFQSKEFTDGIDAESKIRVGILCLLYAKRRANPDLAALSMLDLESLMSFPREHLYFSRWYLKGRRHIIHEKRGVFARRVDPFAPPPGLRFVEAVPSLPDKSFRCIRDGAPSGR